MSSSIKLPLISFFFLSSLLLLLLLQGSLAEVICQNLPPKLCSFAVASSGKRCVLENYMNDQGDMDYTCTSSEVVVETLAGHVETDQCVAACGVDRTSVGISSDAFLAPEFVSKLCSPACLKNCRNIVDLYYNLAAGEGVFLPELCEKQKSHPHRAMQEIMSSGAAVGDSVAASPAYAPAPAPAAF